MLALIVAAVMLLPGAVMIRRCEWGRADPIELSALAVIGSAAYWAITIWLVPWLGISLTWFALLSLLTAAIALVTVRRGAVAAAFQMARRHRAAIAWGLACVAGVLATRLVFAFTRLANSVGDMTAHAYMTELIVMADGLPSTYEPLLPLGGFGEFPPGFHAVSAVLTLLSGVPTYRSTIHVTWIALAALTFVLYALLAGIGVPRVPAAVGAAGALVLARNPQFFEQWGGGPTLLAAATTWLVFRDGLTLLERRDLGFLLRTGAFSTCFPSPWPAASRGIRRSASGSLRSSGSPVTAPWWPRSR